MEKTSTIDLLLEIDYFKFSIDENISVILLNHISYIKNFLIDNNYSFYINENIIYFYKNYIYQFDELPENINCLFFKVDGDVIFDKYYYLLEDIVRKHKLNQIEKI